MFGFIAHIAPSGVGAWSFFSPFCQVEARILQARSTNPTVILEWSAGMKHDRGSLGMDPRKEDTIRRGTRQKQTHSMPLLAVNPAAQ